MRDLDAPPEMGDIENIIAYHVDAGALIPYGIDENGNGTYTIDKEEMLRINPMFYQMLAEVTQEAMYWLCLNGIVYIDHDDNEFPEWVLSDRGKERYETIEDAIYVAIETIEQYRAQNNA